MTKYQSKINVERMEKGLKYRATTDEPCAKLKESVERAAFKAKRVKASIFLHEEGTVAERNAKAEDSHEYDEAMEGYFRSLASHEAMKNKRATEEIVIEVWRSLNAGRNRGNIV